MKPKVFLTALFITFGTSGIPGMLPIIAPNVAYSAMTCSFDLKLHEGGTHNGHTIANHVGQSDSQLKLRLTNDPDMGAASTYASLQQAQSLTDSTICDNKATLDSWLASTAKDGTRLTFSKKFSSITGTSIAADGKTKTNVYGVLVVVQKSSTFSDKFVIITSYPKAM